MKGAISRGSAGTKGEGKYREPDLLLVLDASDPRRQNEYWLGADLVMEIVSPDKPKRDTEEKPNDYAEADIQKYWIINPLTNTITVLILDGDTYVEHGIFNRGDWATSKLIEGFSMSVDEVLDASSAITSPPTGAVRLAAVGSKQTAARTITITATSPTTKNFGVALPLVMAPAAR